MNFILEKNFTYCTNVHSYFEKGNKYISAYKSQCFKEVYGFILGHTHCSTGPHATRGPAWIALAYGIKKKINFLKIFDMALNSVFTSTPQLYDLFRRCHNKIIDKNVVFDLNILIFFYLFIYFKIQKN